MQKWRNDANVIFIIPCKRCIVKAIFSIWTPATFCTPVVELQTCAKLFVWNLVMVASSFSTWELLNQSKVGVLFREWNPRVFCNTRVHKNINIAVLLVLHFSFAHPIPMAALVHKSSAELVHKNIN